MSYLCRNDCSCRQCRQYLRTQSGIGFRSGLHIHLTEHLREEFHAMIVIHRQELVVVLLLDLVRDGFTINDGGHPVLILTFLFSLCWRHFLHIDVAHIHLTTVRSLTIPTLVLVQHRQFFASHHGITSRHLHHHMLVTFQGHEQLFFLLLTLLQVLLHLGIQCHIHTLLAVEHVYRQLVSKVILDYLVYHVKPPCQWVILDRVGCQRLHLLVRQVIHHIRRCSLRLHGQRLRLLVNEDAMRSQTLLPLLVGEIHRRGYQFLIGLGWLRASRSARHRSDDSLQILQHILLLWGIALLLTLVIESITAALQLTRLHPAVPAFRHHRCFWEEQPSSHTAQMPSLLTPWCPT